MSEEVKTKAQAMSEELVKLKAALQLAAGGMDPEVQAIVSHMEEILQPTV